MTAAELLIGVVFGFFGLFISTPIWGYVGMIYAMGPESRTGFWCGVATLLIGAGAFSGGFYAGWMLTGG